MRDVENSVADQQYCNNIKDRRPPLSDSTVSNSSEFNQDSGHTFMTKHQMDNHQEDWYYKEPINVIRNQQEPKERPQRQQEHAHEELAYHRQEPNEHPQRRREYAHEEFQYHRQERKDYPQRRQQHAREELQYCQQEHKDHPQKRREHAHEELQYHRQEHKDYPQRRQEHAHEELQYHQQEQKDIELYSVSDDNSELDFNNSEMFAFIEDVDERDAPTFKGQVSEYTSCYCPWKN
jgi:hypothetical protein